MWRAILAALTGAALAGCARPAARAAPSDPAGRPAASSRPDAAPASAAGPGAPATRGAGAVSGCDGLAVVRFAEHLCAALAADTKRITLRARHRTAIREGQWVQLVCMRSRRRFRARITGVRHTTWRGITDRELADDGFPGRDRLLPIMRRYYPGIGPDDPATVYRWDRSRPCRGPAPAR